MTRPGFAVQFTSTPPSPGTQTGTGAVFMAAVAASGRSDKAVLCHNLTDVVTAFGPRTTTSLLYDTADIMFRSGVVDLYIGRRVGPAATKATITLKDSAAADSISVSSIGAGTSTLEVQAIAGSISDSIVLKVIDSATSKVVEQSPPVLDLASLLNWATYRATTISIAIIGTLIPAVQANPVALAGGATDNASVVDTTLQADLLRLFPSVLGPGQVVVPGATTTAAHIAMANFAQETNRFALWDGIDGSDATAQTTAVQAIQADPTLNALAETYGMYWHRGESSRV